ncbi:hypothetical protein AZE42_11056 [Rhizopogon vesiculosus]|uniref:Major facilitator superfamily (MFS) profile domain-containing protein n=1 Tax=Rhizopogon vesiculosus TaxID=180088 RepID=A0A1J8PX27_9AGAM|nr:hypothetical protein AZE42_11056 [Rhizopogon vesiculosus]
MASEESPLLTSRDGTTHQTTIYERFAPGQKRWIVTVVSLAGFLLMFVQATLVPSIPQIAKDLNSTHALFERQFVNLRCCHRNGGMGSVFFLLWAQIDVFVRDAVFMHRELWCRDVDIVVEPIVLAIRTDVWVFRKHVVGCWCYQRYLQIGGARHGHGYILWCAAAQYWSWRNLHYSIAAWGLLEMLLIYISFPETSHPGTIGIEKVTRRRRFHISWVNPLSSLWLLRSPNLFATTLASSLVLISDYVLLVPLAYTIGVRYGITNEAVIGACFLPNGLGNFLGSPVAGRMSDIVVRKWRARRKGVWYPEDRLRATWIGGLFMVPMSIGASGLLTTYVGGPIGLSLNLLCLFINGMGVDFVLGPIISYNVDVLHSRSAEISAAHEAAQSLIISAATTLVIPSIERIGVAWTNIIAAGLALIGQGIIFLTIRYGDRMRASVDVGFSTIEDN